MYIAVIGFQFVIIHGFKFELGKYGIFHAVKANEIAHGKLPSNPMSIDTAAVRGVS